MFISPLFRFRSPIPSMWPSCLPSRCMLSSLLLLLLHSLISAYMKIYSFLNLPSAAFMYMILVLDTWNCITNWRTHSWENKLSISSSYLAVCNSLSWDWSTKMVFFYIPMCIGVVLVQLLFGEPNCEIPLSFLTGMMSQPSSDTLIILGYS